MQQIWVRAGILAPNVPNMAKYGLKCLKKCPWLSYNASSSPDLMNKFIPNTTVHEAIKDVQNNKTLTLALLVSWSATRAVPLW
eukprot:1158449-Pelagomonas_calceolata.AAC.6